MNRYEIRFILDSSISTEKHTKLPSDISRVSRDLLPLCLLCRWSPNFFFINLYLLSYPLRPIPGRVTCAIRPICNYYTATLLHTRAFYFRFINNGCSRFADDVCFINNGRSRSAEDVCFINNGHSHSAEDVCFANNGRSRSAEDLCFANNGHSHSADDVCFANNGHSRSADDVCFVNNGRSRSAEDVCFTNNGRSHSAEGICFVNNGRSRSADSYYLKIYSKCANNLREGTAEKMKSPAVRIVSNSRRNKMSRR